MRSSSGGWLRNSFFMPWPMPPAMPNASTWAGSVLGRCCCFRRSSAAIIFCRPASEAPPWSARNSRRRENHMAIMVANRPNTTSSTITMM